MDKSRKTLTLVSGLILFGGSLISHPGPAFSAPAGFDDAVKTYNSRQYSAALSKFSQVAATNPSDVTSRYYMGMCYQGLNQMTLAVQQYQWVAQASRDPVLRDRAQQAVAQLSRYQTQKVGYNSGPFAGGSRPAGGSSGAPVSISGRLKIYEFSTSW